MAGASLFTTEELRVYLRKTVEEFDTESAALLVDLTAEEVNGATDSIPVDARAKGLALEVCARAYRSTNEKISETIDDYTYRLRGENFDQRTGVYLTAEERRRLRRWAGLRNPGSIRLRDSRWQA